MNFETNPVVKLEGVIQDPYNLAVATARTCYSAKGIIRTRDVSLTEKAKRLRDKIALSTREAGHLTTRQHAHFVFSLDKVSRQFIWSFLHAHPYYNSEQVSQRYVKVAPGHFTVPQLPEQAAVQYKKIFAQQTSDYLQLIDLCLPEVERRFFQVFPYRVQNRSKYESFLQKKAYEIARYVLGVATHAYLYHTVSALTLMRYHRLCHYFDVPLETRVVVEQMVAEVLKIDPLFAKELGDPLPLDQTPEYAFFMEHQQKMVAESTGFIDEFDGALAGKYAKLIDYKINAPQTLAQGVRSVLGLSAAQLTQNDALDLLLNPAKNNYYADTLNIGSLTKLNRVLAHAHYTFRKKISHAADSQDQRHRTIPGSRPILSRHFTGKPDYITPLIILENNQLNDFYQKSMEKTFEGINQLLNDGVETEKALYLLPNAFPIRFEESGNLLDLHHKWKARSCYTAQEEIFFATLDELEDVAKVHPELTKHILAPCYLRYQANIKPFCPEGDRFCGVRVWKDQLDAYRGRLL